MQDTESPPKVMRRLDYSSALDEDDVGGGEAPPISTQAQDSVDHNDAEQTASLTSPLPTTPQSRGKNTLSSRTSLLGRRLAEERSRNHQLSLELEHIKSLLEKEMKRNNDISFDLNESFYSSSPVNTPTTTPVKCQVSDSTQSTPLAAAMKEESINEDNNINTNIHRIQELEVALQIETKLRKDVQAKLIELERSKILEQKATKHYLQIENDSPIHEYLQRASHLKNETNSFSKHGSSPLPGRNGYKNSTHNSYNSLHSIDEDEEVEEDDQEDEDRKMKDMSLSNVLDKMQEYEELVTAFHSEQQSNQDEMLSKDDVLWFFEELKWRFADIHQSLSAIPKEPISSDAQDNSEEWKSCLIGLVDELEYSMRKSKERISDNDDRFEANAIAALKRSYEEQLATQSQRIEQLEADVAERESQLADMQQKIQQDYHLIEEEKKKLSLRKDGTAARIRYLENMVQSLQVKLKNTQTQPHFEKSTPNKTKDTRDSYASEIDSLANALADSELKRARLIDEFQIEREKYITQYKQMNDVLKQFVCAESNHNM